ncbi:sigma-54 dependent transcriptional regulator [Geomonas subterranea]|uniref:Sigma-54 dependent transcriptional regulator n=1 Tax=Geomonas subterranea TaxID=2847989 RepID=A0ABX8LLT5_9BACT|nr:sigma-54 dependent transcriptional regulator [Geomonas subterranea]QXE92306.1 sigma-54 dependent transcriptional regulator [Geomonas subterranea]QXM09595.1 sigma-54 dependent transcriptional regulator [Geomonas subterranea]
MGRLDVRVRTHLDSTVCYLAREDTLEERVTIRELSLSGALVVGLSTQLSELFAIRPVLPGTGEVELLAKLVRQGKGGSAIRLYYSDQNTMQALWEHIRDHLPPTSSCPYCGHPDDSREGSCDNCNLYLNFSKKNYLERHIENTFAQRLNIRLSRLNLEHIQKIIHFVDSKLLKIQHRSPDREFIGTSPGMLTVFSMLRKVAPTEMSVLLLGESGTGKEVTARSLHTLSGRRDGPFVAVNCAAIPETLLEAELFGYEKGAFTGAYATKKGKFESADGGTLFLDEIGDLPATLQAKLLRFLEDRLVQPVGSALSKKIDVRIVAATNCDLQLSMAQGRFRTDLFYRLNSFTIKLPPLRERGDDKVRLATYFLEKFSRNENRFMEFSEEALEAIRRHPWPGNVRELENKVRRGFLMASGRVIDPECMELDQVDPAVVPDPEPKPASAQRDYVIKVLEQNGYVIAKAARQMQISRPSMYALIKKHGISRDDMK